MKLLKVIAVMILSMSLIISCSQKPKEMTAEDFFKIEKEINLPDPDLNPEKSKEVVSKYGYTVEQFKAFSAKKEKDPKIKEQLGDIQLKEQKK
jgi:hypothetical protein